LADRRIAEPKRIELIVFSSLFPSAARPGAGLFIRERMFRVANIDRSLSFRRSRGFPGSH